MYAWCSPKRDSRQPCGRSRLESLCSRPSVHPWVWFLRATSNTTESQPDAIQTTVLGVTRSRRFCHPAQSFLNMSQNSFCMADSRRRGRLACRANSCCRRARFSRMRSSLDLTTLTTQPRRCRSHTIIAKNLTGFKQVEVSAKSLILRMRVVLTRDNSELSDARDAGAQIAR